MSTEPKDVQTTVEELFDELSGGEQPQESSPVTEPVEVKEEDGSDPVKTQSTPDATEDKGFASHPKWIEREQKLKEARESLQAKEAEVSRYSKLLDDPQVYAVWLKQQGYSDAHIQQAMREKGFQTPNAETTEKSNQAQAIAERACAKLGWDITRLTPDQKAYINDSVSLTMAIIQEAVGPMIEQRVRPYEEVSNSWRQENQFNQEESGVKELAEKEFPEVDWATTIQPAIQKFLNELDEKDPKRTIKLSYEDIYYRATRPLLRELTESKGRQEVRDTNKRNARPLGQAPSTKVGEPTVKRSARDEAEAFLDAKGVH